MKILLEFVDKKGMISGENVIEFSEPLSNKTRKRC